MLPDDVAKQLLLKTNIVKRILKELVYYGKEKEKETAKVEKLRADGASVSDLKQAVRVFVIVGPLSVQSVALYLD